MVKIITAIYTTYFANLKKLPKDIIPISIAVKPPAGYRGLVYSKLFPPTEIMNQFKRTKDEAQFMREYNARVLSALNPYEVLKELNQLVIMQAKLNRMAYTNGTEAEIEAELKVLGAKIAFVFYEKPGYFCHRKMVARWFKNIGVDVKEYTG